MINRRELVIGSAGLAALGAPLVARAFPERPVRLVIPMAAGGGTDAIARMLTQKMAETLGQPLVIENKAGAAGQIGVEYVMTAPKDGYTLLLCSSTPLTLPYLRQTRYDLLRDFVPIGQVSNGNFVLVTNKNLPFTSARAFLDDAKRHPNKYTYGSPGNGSLAHMALALLKTKAGIEMTHVPYKSSGEVAQALMAGHLDCAIDVLTLQKNFIEAGSVRGLATTGTERDPGLPQLPTLQELNISPSGYSISFWYGVFMPAGVPAESRARVQAAFDKAMAEPDVQAALVRLGQVPSKVRGDAFRKLMEDSVTQWKKVIKENNMAGI